MSSAELPPSGTSPADAAPLGCARPPTSGPDEKTLSSTLRNMALSKELTKEQEEELLKDEDDGDDVEVDEATADVLLDDEEEVLSLHAQVPSEESADSDADTTASTPRMEVPAVVSKAAAPSGRAPPPPAATLSSTAPSLLAAPPSGNAPLSLAAEPMGDANVPQDVEKEKEKEEVVPAAASHAPAGPSSNLQAARTGSKYDNWNLMIENQSKEEKEQSRLIRSEYLTRRVQAKEVMGSVQQTHAQIYAAATAAAQENALVQIKRAKDRADVRVAEAQAESKQPAQK